MGFELGTSTFVTGFISHGFYQGKWTQAKHKLPTSNPFAIVNVYFGLRHAEKDETLFLSKHTQDWAVRPQDTSPLTSIAIVWK